MPKKGLRINCVSKTKVHKSQNTGSTLQGDLLVHFEALSVHALSALGSDMVERGCTNQHHCKDVVVFHKNVNQMASCAAD